MSNTSKSELDPREWLNHRVIVVRCLPGGERWVADVMAWPFEVEHSTREYDTPQEAFKAACKELKRGLADQYLEATSREQ